MYVRQARERGIPVKTYTVLMHDVDRAITDGEEDGFVKIHVREGTDKILGATVVARHAGEMINGISLAMVAGIGPAHRRPRDPHLSDAGRSDQDGGGGPCALAVVVVRQLAIAPVDQPVSS